MESCMREIRTYGLGRQEAGNRFLTFIRRPLCRDFNRISYRQFRGSILKAIALPKRDVTGSRD